MFSKNGRKREKMAKTGTIGQKRKMDKNEAKLVKTS
jgi:hypothetical protein